jgi:hypothetical protein
VIARCTEPALALKVGIWPFGDKLIDLPCSLLPASVGVIRYGLGDAATELGTAAALTSTEQDETAPNVPVAQVCAPQ